MGTFNLNGAYDFIINSNEKEATIEFLIPGVEKEAVKVSTREKEDWNELVVRVFDGDVQNDETVLKIGKRWVIKDLTAKLALGILTIKFPLEQDKTLTEHTVK